MAKTSGDGKHISGWCATNKHEICILETISGIVCECECENHGVHKDDWKDYQRKEQESWNSTQVERTSGL